MLFFWTFYSSENPKKTCATVPTVLNFDINQKLFLSSKSVYYYDFWRSCDTEDWSNDAENTALITEINYILTHIHIENSYLKLLKYITILQLLLYF